MRTGKTNGTPSSEIAILANVLGNGHMPPSTARYLVGVGFSDADKVRMRRLAKRNQEDALSPAEKQELLAYAKAGTLLSILKSKARRALNVKPKKRTAG
jgi:hypothetical protein